MLSAGRTNRSGFERSTAELKVIQIFQFSKEPTKWNANAKMVFRYLKSAKLFMLGVKCTTKTVFAPKFGCRKNVCCKFRFYLAQSKDSIDLFHKFPWNVKCSFEGIDSRESKNFVDVFDFSRCLGKKFDGDRKIPKVFSGKNICAWAPRTNNS